MKFIERERESGIEKFHNSIIKLHSTKAKQVNNLSIY